MAKEDDGANEGGFLILVIVIEIDRFVIAEDGKQLVMLTVVGVGVVREQVVVGKEVRGDRSGDVGITVEGKMIWIYPFWGILSVREIEKV